MLQLVQAQLNVLSYFSTRVPIPRTTYAVDAAAGAGSTERLDSLSRPVFEQLACTTCVFKATAGAGPSGRNAICDASRNTVITPRYSTYARKVNPKYIAPIAISARRYDAVLPDSTTRPRRAWPPVQSIWNPDDTSNQSCCRKP